MSESKGFSGLEGPGEEAGRWGARAGKETCASVSGVGPGAAWGLGRGLPWTGLSMVPFTPSFYRVTNFCQVDKKRNLVGVNAAVSQGGKAHSLYAAMNRGSWVLPGGMSSCFLPMQLGWEES